MKDECYYDIKGITKEDIAYLAGYIDADGTFSIYKTKNYRKDNGEIYFNFKTALMICSTHKEIIYWIKDIFKTNRAIIYRDHAKRKTERTNPLLTFQFNGKFLEEVTEIIIPFLKIKKRHAELMLEMRKTFVKYKNNKIDEKTYEIRDFLHNEMHKCNLITNARMKE